MNHETHKVGVLFGYYVCGAYVCSLVLALQMPATNLGGYTKRSTGVALVFLAYCAGNIIGPHAFLAKEAPIYQTGCKMIVSCAAAQAVLALYLRMLLISRNKKRDATASNEGVEGISQADELADLTDFEVRLRNDSLSQVDTDMMIESKLPLCVLKNFQCGHRP
jgi:hypothetical protein